MCEDNNYVIKGLPPLQPIPDISIGQLLYNKLLENCDDEGALIDAITGEIVTYRELLSKSCSLAENLRRAGYDKNTVISICSENSILFFIPILSALYIGATVAPINHNYTKTELSHSLNIARPRIVFCSKQTYQKFGDFNFIEKVLIIEDILGVIDTNLYRFNLEQVNVDNVAFILNSSGTTGLPKGVMITHRNVLVRFMHTNDHRLSSTMSRSIFGLLPFFHAYGLFVSLTSIYRRVKIIVMRRFEEKLFLQSIEKYRITSLTLVPPLAVFLSKSPLVEKYDLSSVQEARCGAAPLSKNTETLLKKRLKIKSLVQAYGLTETTLGVMGMPQGKEKPGSSGKIYPYILCKVRDPETGKSLGPNQEGELCFKGPIVMKGYYRNEEATKNAFTTDGWLLTGDLGYYDKEEYFYITGRLKELIKYKGFQVAPAELEAILLTHPKIKDVAVIGAPDEDAGELPMAFVVKNSDDLSEEEVKDFLNNKVSSYKRLRGGVIFVEEIPKNPSGKILRRKLKEMFDSFIRINL